MKKSTYDNTTVKAFVSEPLAAYGGAMDFSSLMSDKFKMAEVIEAGVPFSFFDRLRTVFAMTLQEWSEYLEISLKSLHRYQHEDRSFKPIHSEKIMELAEVMVTGMDVFEDGAKLRLWLETPSLALGKKRPKDLIKNSYGKELIMRELMALEYGIFA